MSSNYLMMKEEENKLFQTVVKFFKLTIEIHEYNMSVLADEKGFSKNQLKTVRSLEAKSNAFYSDIVEESSWLIQKHRPRASHLRYLIATINTAKELERASDYAVDISELLEKPEFDNESKKDFIEVYTNAFKLIKKMFKNFKDKSFELDVKNRTQTKLVEYSDFVDSSIYQVIKETKKIKEADVYNTNINIIIAITKIQRVVEHVYNILKAYSYISIQSED